MTGRLILESAPIHSCSPGWKWNYREDGPAGAGDYGIPPAYGEYPKGSVWRCDCGKTWVSLGLRGAGHRATGWRREGSIARRRRERGQCPPVGGGDVD